MKYIRTKDGRMVDSSQCKICEELVGKPLNPQKGWLIYKENIFKQAGTIEELCDEFVIKKIDQPKPFVYTIYFTDLQKYANDKDWTIYGAIWTDKGLIYVAKRMIKEN